MCHRIVPIVAACALLGLGGPTRAGEDTRRPTVVPEATLRLLANEVNGFAAFNTLATIATYHRVNGSGQLHELLVRMQQRWKDAGFSGVEILRVPVRTGHEFFGLQTFGGQAPGTVRSATLRLVKPYPKLLITTDAAPSGVVSGSRSADITAPVVFVGKGDDPRSYEGKDVKGKLVLAGNAWPDAIREMAIHRFGAAGVLMYIDIPTNSGDNDDANLDSWWSPWADDGTLSTFGFMLSTNQYRLLRGLLDRGDPVVVHAKVDAEIPQGESGAFETLDAVIPGSRYPDQEFLIWAHIDHPLPGAVDNASGAAVVMEIARTLQALVDNGLLPPPQRTIRFLWVPHVTGLYMYLTRHPEKVGKIRGGLSIDSVGIDQSVFSSYFSVSKPSHALASWWTAVLENLVDHLARRTNRDLLDWGNQDGLFAPEGSRQQYNIRLDPYNGGGDEFQTNNNTVGVPTIAFGSAPVPPRHSQVNGVNYIDPTGLHRVSYLGATLAYAFGWTDPDSAWRITDEVYHRGRSHLVAEAGKAEQALMDASGASLAQAYSEARHLVRCGGERELAMLASIRLLVPDARDALARIEDRRRDEAAFVESLTAALKETFERRARQLGVPAVAPEATPEERRLDAVVPVPVPGILGTSAYFGDYYEKVLGKETLASFHLKPDFAYGVTGYTEAHNFIDGRRSILEIYQATTAELTSEGYPHAHDISLAEVDRYMGMLAAAKVITLESRRRVTVPEKQQPSPRPRR